MPASCASLGLANVDLPAHPSRSSPCGRLDVAGEDAHQSRFTGAVLADDRVDFAGQNVEVDLGQTRSRDRIASRGLAPAAPAHGGLCDARRQNGLLRLSSIRVSAAHPDGLTRRPAEDDRENARCACASPSRPGPDPSAAKAARMASCSSSASSVTREWNMSRKM